MNKTSLQKRLAKATFDKQFFNRTLLKYYKRFREAAEALEGKPQKK